MWLTYKHFAYCTIMYCTDMYVFSMSKILFFETADKRIQFIHRLISTDRLPRKSKSTFRLLK